MNHAAGPIPGARDAGAAVAAGVAGRPRRVLVVAPQPFYEDRGTPIAVHSVLRALMPLGWEADLATFPVGRPADLPGVTVHRAANPFRFTHVPVGLSLRKLVLDVALLRVLVTCLRARHYDAIHAVEETIFPALVVGRSFGVPVIYDMQSSLPEQLAAHPVARVPGAARFFAAAERWALERADVIACSAGLGRRVEAVAPGTVAFEWHFPHEAGEPRPGGTAGLRTELGLEPDTPVVLYAGTFEPYQGLDILLDAMPRILAAVPGAVFVLVGADGPCVADVEARIAAGRLESHVRLVPRQPRSLMPAYLDLAHVLVSPRSHGDNLPLKVFDYLAAAKPVVATDIPAHRILLDGSVARFTAPEPGSLAAGIVELLQDPRLAGEYARCARELATRRFGWPAFVELVGRIYDAALRAAPRRLAARAPRTSPVPSTP